MGINDLEGCREAVDALLAILEAKDEIHKFRNETDKELRERRNEVQRQEKRMIQKEENLDKRTENLEKKEEQLDLKIKQAENQLSEAESIKRSQLEMLEKISGYTKEQAKIDLIQTIEESLKREKAVKQTGVFWKMQVLKSTKVH